ncbi:MAG: DUF2339 domain-containing protein [Opitutaceae bacterium]
MEAFLVLLGFYLFAVLVVLPIWTIVKILGQRRDHEILQQQITTLQQEIETQRAELKSAPIAPAPSSVPAAPAVVTAQPAVGLPPAPLPVRPAIVAPSPVMVAPVATPTPSPVPAAEPPPLPPVLIPPRPVYVSPKPAKPVINWEQFMGAKLFAWLGGFALFLGVAFFVKYSFEHDLIPPEVRVALGFLLGAALIVGGLKITSEKLRVTSRTLVATGVVSLYAVTFACNSVYHFAFFGPIPTFLLMALITAAAFILAVRLAAPVVAILGILGGFLTPVLINTGHDNPPGLFGYLALLNVGLIAVALHRRWFYLVPLGVTGTVLMMVGWADRFYAPEKTTTAMTICLGFCALFIGANDLARRRGRADPLLSWSAAALPFVAFAFAFHFLGYPTVAAQAGHFLGFVLLTDAALLILAWRDESLPRIHLAGGVVAFLLLAGWTSNNLTDALLPWGLVAYLLFAALHTVFPLLLERRRPETAPSAWSQLFPPLTLLLMLVPIFKLDSMSLLIWPAILLVDMLAIGFALLSASLVAVAAVLVLTLVATGACIFRVPAALAFDPSLLFIIGGFAVFFFAAGLWLVRKLGAKLPAADQPLAGVFGDARAQLPAFASLLPFLLLIMVCLRLNVPNPSAVFGLGLLLVVLTLGLARLLVIEWLPACALAGMAALEYAWHSHYASMGAPLPLGWYLGFYAVFTVYPFLFRSVFAQLTGPWAMAALSGLAHFWMIYAALKPMWPADLLGAIPALFALAPLASLMLILRGEPADHPARLNQLAWFGGVALFFITLVFPVQFERQWLTVAWALEGAALLWLFYRVPHRGLQATGAVLLVVAFARLALNPAVFEYHARSTTPIFNWYLYAYGLAIACLFVGAWLTAPPRNRVLGIDAPPLFNALGVILAFFLLNIEIADYFTSIGSSALTWQFSGNFARDMSYTIAWALFALGLLVAGIWKKTKLARYAAIALLSVALLKLFFHDLARLAQLYRIGALFAVAVIAILASFAYQRFLPSNEKSPPS